MLWNEKELELIDKYAYLIESKQFSKLYYELEPFNQYIRGDIMSALHKVVGSEEFFKEFKDSIPKDIFVNGKSLDRVVIPDGVWNIGQTAFAGTSLESITIPDSVTSIGMSAFTACNSLINITLPKNLTYINSNLFYLCSKLKNVVIPDSVEKILEYAFRDCTSLENIILPKGLKKIYKGAFYDCTNLKTVIFQSFPDYMDRLFLNCRNLQRVYGPKDFIEWAHVNRRVLGATKYVEFIKV